MLITAVIVAVVLFVFFHPIVVYFLDKNRLRKFPAPSVAGLTSIWRIVHNLRNRHYLAIHEAHKALGSHVRIAPKHVSISDPRALPEIYGHGANFLKDGWYDSAAGEYRDMNNARVKSVHQEKRKTLAHVFALKTIKELEPVVLDVTAKLVLQLDRHISEGKTINLRRYLNYYTIDLFSRILFGESLDCLERGDDTVTAETPQGKTYKVPFIKTMHDSVVFNTILGMEAHLLPITRMLFSWHPCRKAGYAYEQVIFHNTKKRMLKSDCQDDIFSKLLRNAKGEEMNLAYGDILAECGTMMNAGTDTTTAALTNTIFLLYKHPDVLAKLRKELDEKADTREFVNYDTLASLPYLRACIEESLRVRPASSFGLPRVVPEGGRTIAGEFISEGVTVSVPTYTILRSAEHFENPEQYDPERWIQGDKEKMSKAHFPFSTGPRACIGRNIAYFEQLLVIGTLARLFDFEYESQDFELKTIERFNSNPGEMVLKCRRRRF